MRKKTFLTIFIYLIFCIFKTPIFCFGNSTNISSKEKIVEEEIHYLKIEVKQLEKKSKTLNNEIEILEREREILIKEKTKTLFEKKENEKQINKLKNYIESANKEIKTKKKYLNMRILELYKKGEFILLEMILFPKSEELLIHSLNTFHHLNSKDKEEIKLLSNLIKEKKSAEKKLILSKKELNKKLFELTNLQQSIRKSFKKRKKLFRTISTKKKNYTKLLNERNSLLKELINTLEGHSNTNKVPIVSIAKFKKLLTLPAKGRIIERFGRIRNKKFGTYLKNNGITMKVNKNKDVKAFYDGTVVFANWYKSYGKLIIIDHKEGYFSFYAHLNSFSVKINQIVFKDDVIAKSGDTASLKGNIFHFELWHKKTPLNPLKWIKTKRK